MSLDGEDESDDNLEARDRICCLKLNGLSKS